MSNEKLFHTTLVCQMKDGSHRCTNWYEKVPMATVMAKVGEHMNDSTKDNPVFSAVLVGGLHDALNICIMPFEDIVSELLEEVPATGVPH